MANLDNAKQTEAATLPLDEQAIVHELASLITQALNLDLQADKIDPDMPLYGEGLGLDSIDILEIALVVAKRYDLQLKADSEENSAIFRSLRHLAHYVAANSQVPMHTAEVNSTGSN